MRSRVKPAAAVRARNCGFSNVSGLSQAGRLLPSTSGLMGWPCAVVSTVSEAASGARVLVGLGSGVLVAVAGTWVAVGCGVCVAGATGAVGDGGEAGVFVGAAAAAGAFCASCTAGFAGGQAASSTSQQRRMIIPNPFGPDAAL